MKDGSLKIIVLFSISVCHLLSCNESQHKKENVIVAAPAGLYSITANLPEAPGYKAFQNNCMSCHSARYVQMQPNLSEKTWLALVTKMQKSFGAPVPDSSVAEIVQYLVAIRGKD